MNTETEGSTTEESKPVKSTIRKTGGTCPNDDGIYKLHIKDVPEKNF